MSEVLEKSKQAKIASQKLALTSTKVKNYVLQEMGKALKKNANDIIRANSLDLEAGEKKGLSRSLLDRLALDGKRINSMVEALQIVISQKDPVGEVIEKFTRPNGLMIKKIRVPLGVIGIIYEARPNVTVDAASLCLKAGNTVVLRGSSVAINSNLAIFKTIAEAAYNSGLPEGSLQLIEDTDRKSVEEMMGLREYIDVLIPRGGKSLIQSIVQNAKIPTIETGEGNCHAYVEKSADLTMAANIVFNAKVSRPSVCNAIETLLVDREIAEKFLPKMLEKLKSAGVEIRGDKEVKKLDPEVKNATEEDWATEFLDLILAVKVVPGIDEAISHINKYGTKHSETIITKNVKLARQFCAEVDAAACYTNASTRFTDGGEFGFGAEIGISTQKLHARGPMGLKELTSYKYIVEGTGQIR